MADQLEQPADLPLGHRAEPQPRHVDERPQVRRHDEVRPGRVREDEPGVLARDAGGDEVAVDAHRALDLRPRTRSRRSGVGVLDRGGQHRRRALERDVALALLVERDAGPMADELVRERPRHAADPEREDDVLDRRAVARLDHALDQLLLLRRVDLAGRPPGGRSPRGVELGVAGPAGGVDQRDVEPLDDVAVGEEERRLHPELAPAGVLRDAGLLAGRSRRRRRRWAGVGSAVMPQSSTRIARTPRSRARSVRAHVVEQYREVGPPPQ